MTARTLCIAGVSGLLGSYLARLALLRGWRVNGTMRDVCDTSKTAPLEAMPGARERLRLFPADTADPASFDAPLRGAGAVLVVCFPTLHAARDGTPASELDVERAVAEIVSPVEQGCVGLLAAAHRQGVQTVVLGSSTASTNAPFPKMVKNEIDHIADPDEQIALGNYNAAQKCLMERSACAFAGRHGQRLSVMLPSMLVGPALLPHHLDGHVLSFLVNLLEGRKGWHDVVPTGSMSLSHPADVAALFLAACERQDASGRYFALKDSWSWRDLYAEIGRHAPADCLPRPLVGEPHPPTFYDFTRRDSLGVALRDISTTFAETFAWLKTTSWRSRR